MSRNYPGDLPCAVYFAIVRAVMTSQSTTREGATIELGRKAALALRTKKVLALDGVYGSGKTTFVRGLARGFNIRRIVRSPTFLIMHSYPICKNTLHRFVHIDLWRTHQLSKEDRGTLHEVLTDPHAVVAIEWPRRLPRGLRKFIDIFYVFTITGPRSRRISIYTKKIPRR